MSNTNTLQNDMAINYDFFSSRTIRNEPIISIPYVDAFGTGKKRHACSLQVYNVELGFQMITGSGRFFQKEFSLRLSYGES